ncbi:arylsulfatase [Akkermansiaceae bacterium]|nr:arylsulfatase [Akkermansiaceae bacterium]MDA7659231.1 arylsulfatase [Akkermansiaceae bacterium]MDA7895293.1 arylsulfatase [Akkermansiaceae bacterium]MDB4523759.1 arylsulfatase [Akkermansiaceae bacterium]MDC0296539.1 arylsulfatase [Akkermansiaceae bacterium]
MISLLFSILGNLSADSRPNIVVFLSDDQGWGDLSHSGNKDLKTSNIDSLARDGVSFHRFFVCPVCSPTRAEFLTGRYHPRSNVYSTSAGGERMDLDEMTIADLFQKSGYATGAFGKWHNGMQFPYHPNGRGFDEFYGFCSGHWGNYFSPMLERNGEIVEGKGFCIDDFTTQAMEFMEKSKAKSQPFFAYLPYNTPHSPMQVPDEYWGRFTHKNLKMKAGDRHLRSALAMCENLDYNVGRVLAKLDQLKVAKNTIIVWFHDNGPNGKRWNGGMKGRKGSVEEGGCRSPLFIKWPGRIKKGRQIEQIASVRDLLPTLCELAGIKALPPSPLDGKSLVALINNSEAEWEDRIFVNQWKSKFGVRSQNYRLGAKGELFDMTSDPEQLKPIKNEKVSRKLRKALAKYKTEVLPGYGGGKDERGFVIAHPGSKLTQLPARDAVATGGLKRSNRFPNDSYFESWNSIDDRITWKAEAGESGAFEVEIFYATKSGGAKYRLSFKGDELDFVIPNAHDVPKLGAGEDRSPRNESYTKDWARLKVGRIELTKGEGELVLEALKIPGNEAMEFRLLTLRRIE